MGLREYIGSGNQMWVSHMQANDLITILSSAHLGFLLCAVLFCFAKPHSDVFRDFYWFSPQRSLFVGLRGPYGVQESNLTQFCAMQVPLLDCFMALDFLFELHSDLCFSLHIHKIVIINASVLTISRPWHLEQVSYDFVKSSKGLNIQWSIINVCFYFSVGPR